MNLFRSILIKITEIMEDYFSLRENLMHFFLLLRKTLFEKADVTLI